MIKIVILAVVSIFFTGCSPFHYQQAIEKHFPDCEYRSVFGRSHCFIVKEKDGTFWAVQLTGDGGFTSKEKLFTK